jgi:hypothetical protein
MASGELFSGILQGFSGVLLDRQQQRAEQNINTQKQLTALYAAAIERGDIDAEVGIPLLSQTIAESLQETGLFSGSIFGGKKSKKPSSPFMDMLGDPEQLSGLLTGLHGGLKQAEAQGQRPSSAVGSAIPSRGYGNYVDPNEIQYGPVGSPAAMIPGPDEHEQQVPSAPTAPTTSAAVTPPAQPVTTQPVTPVVPTAATPTAATPAAPVRRGIWTTREEKNRRAIEQAGHQTTGEYRAKIALAQKMVQDGIVQNMSEALDRVGMGIGGANRATRWERFAAVPSAQSSTGWRQKVYLSSDPTVFYWEEAPNPLTRSVGARNERELVAAELFPDPTNPDKDPRLRLSELDSDQLEAVDAEVRRREVLTTQQQAQVRETERLEAEDRTLLTPTESQSLQLAYGLTRGQAKQLGRLPIDAQQRQAGQAAYLFENDAQGAEELFDRIWPRRENPIARRGDLLWHKANGTPDFVLLQAKLKSLSLKRAALEGNTVAPISDRDLVRFDSAFPSAKDDDFSIFDAPTSYEAGKEMFAAARSMAKTVTDYLGIVSPAARTVRPPQGPRPDPTQKPQATPQAQTPSQGQVTPQAIPAGPATPAAIPTPAPVAGAQKWEMINGVLHLNGVPF